MRTLLTVLCCIYGFSFTSTALASDNECSRGSVVIPLNELDGLGGHDKRYNHYAYPRGYINLRLPCRDDDKDDEEPKFAPPSVNNPIDQKCNVPAYYGIREACYAYNNPPMHIMGMKVDAKDACYTTGIAIYNDILEMSVNVPTASVPAYEDAAQHALKQAYYNCKNGKPGFTTLQFLQRMASPF